MPAKKTKSESKAKIGDKVKVEYHGTLEDGTVFDSSTHGDHSHPIEFQLGSKQVIPGFENAMIGMENREEKEIKLLPSEAYGDHNPELVKKLPRDRLPPEIQPKEGMILVLNAPNGIQIPTKIVKVEDSIVTIDLNHPLAGKTLKFKIKLLGISC